MTRFAISVSLFCAIAISAHATTITVINTNDSGPGSLRQALAVVNDGDTIDFDPSLKGQTVTLTTAELVISKNMTINGLGADLLAVSRAPNAPAFRIFHLLSAHTVVIQSLTISNGLAAQFGFGGGILNEGSTLSVINCAVSGNSTDSTGGGISDGFMTGGTLMIESSTLSGNYAGDYGGGIENSGTLTINNSTLSGNTGEFAGGGIYNQSGLQSASLTVSNSTFAGNVTQLHGGGIYNTRTGAGAAVVEIGTTILKRGASGQNIGNNSGTVTSRGYNLSSDDGGGYLIGSGDQINTDPLLGPLQDNGGSTLTHLLLPNSPAINAGNPGFTPPPFFDQRGPGFSRVVNGRIDIGSVEVQLQGPVVTNTNDSGPGSLREALVNAQNGDVITFNIPMGKAKARREGAITTITLTSGELVINKNITISGPGANLLAVSRATTSAPFRIFHVTQRHTVMIEGLAISNGLVSNGFGGGILNDQSTLTINSCALSENSASGQSGLGGAIFSNGSGAGGSASLTITDTTLSANIASNGGAIFNDGASGMAGLIISNSTLSGNSQNGIFSDGTAIISITNSTVNENAAVNISIFAGMLDIGNTVLKAAAPGVNLNIGKPATVTSLGYNLSSDDAGGFLTGTGDQINTDPLLGSLQDNGGPTFTHELLPNSPALDTGDPAFTPPPFHDQRGPGFVRVVDGRLDKGSFEVQGPTATPTATSTPSPTSAPTATVTPTATFTPTPTATSTPTVTPTLTPTATPRPTPTPRTNPTPRPRPTAPPRP